MQFREALRIEGISQKEFAQRINGTPAGVSRDLHGGLRGAKLKRLERLARAICYELVVTLRRKNSAARKD
jgi:transcriptional regulator with XRE-family HTH domain